MLNWLLWQGCCKSLQFNIRICHSDIYIYKQAKIKNCLDFQFFFIQIPAEDQLFEQYYSVNIHKKRLQTGYLNSRFSGYLNNFKSPIFAILWCQVFLKCSKTAISSFSVFVYISSKFVRLNLKFLSILLKKTVQRKRV